MLKVDPMYDMVNIENDQPELIFGPSIDGQSGDSVVPPFYLNLRIHQFILHNSMLDSGASHNLMPKAIMERLGLDITREYHDLYSFDSGKVRYLSLIKDLVVYVDQIPAKNVLMDVVVADIPPWFGMLLSRSRGAKLRGTLQLYFSYATILVFGQLRKLYQETKMKFMINNKDKPNNHPINVVHTNLESFILYNDSGLNDVDSQLMEIKDVPEVFSCIGTISNHEKERLPSSSEPSPNKAEKGLEKPSEKVIENLEQSEDKVQKIDPKQKKYVQPLEEESGIWTIDFDGALGKDKEDLKEYDKKIIQHTIPIKPDQKPFRKKLRRINPRLLPSIEKEVNKLYKVGIIVPIKFFDWISNLVPTRKKNGEIRLCVDFRNLNKVSMKDNYPLPKMDHIL
eukprot:PITA_31171